MTRQRRILIAGATSYMGRALTPALLARGHSVAGVVRPHSRRTLAAGVARVEANPLDGVALARAAAGFDTLVQLVGTPRPSPLKARQFETVDLAAGLAAVDAVRAANISHLVYISVAQPAPVMRAYQRVRARVEAAIREAGINATIVRPWYVLGPGHRWPYVLLPFYWAAERIPPLRAGAHRLGLITIDQMVRALAAAVEDPPAGVRVIGVREIRAGRSSGQGT